VAMSTREATAIDLDELAGLLGEFYDSARF
jgi:hypothetical protein